MLTGTILNKHYTPANPSFASIPLTESGPEPTVLFFGIENPNGVYARADWSGVIWGGDDEEYTVPGTRGWYLMVLDTRKELVQSNYQVKLVP